MKAMPKFGFAAVVGRPNVGKSTLVNALIGAKVAIVSKKPQTTWFNVRGILTKDDTQLILVDTPGLHESTKLINMAMTQQSLEALRDADVGVYVLEPDLAKLKEDMPWFGRLIDGKKPWVAVVNRLEKASGKERERLLQGIQESSPFGKVIGISALSKEGLDGLILELKAFMKEGAWLYEPDMLSDSSVRFLAKEFIKESIFQELWGELPYETAVVINDFREDPQDPVVISAEIWVNRESQKSIVIGKGGEMIKRIGSTARLTIEELLGRHVYLELYAKIKPNWLKSSGLLKQAGFPGVPLQEKKKSGLR
jgi:GTP-binding protein Era